MKIPKIETLIILVFFGCVALWAMSKCGAKRSTLVRNVPSQNEEAEERPPRRDTVRLPASTIQTQQPVQQPVQQTVQQPVNTQRPNPQPAATAPVTTPTTPVNVARPTRSPATSAPAPTTQPKYATLYVTIDGLKMRKTPGLKGELVSKLELYEPVFFLNQKSEKREEISLGYEKVTDHWVKVRTQSGKEGWVFGAGVHYYKMKRKGVMD